MLAALLFWTVAFVAWGLRLAQTGGIPPRRQRRTPEV